MLGWGSLRICRSLALPMLPARGRGKEVGMTTVWLRLGSHGLALSR